MERKDGNIIGVDYSILSPAITILNNGITTVCVGDYENTIVNNYSFIFNKVITQETSIKTYDWMGNVFSYYVNENDNVFLESYAYSRQPCRMMQLAECTGIFKNKIWDFHTFTPQQIKKFATGKGNAQKIDMIDAFREQTGIDLFDLLKMKKTKTLKAPITDIADSFWIAQLGKSVLN